MPFNQNLLRVLLRLTVLSSRTSSLVSGLDLQLQFDDSQWAGKASEPLTKMTLSDNLYFK